MSKDVSQGKGIPLSDRYPHIAELYRSTWSDKDALDLAGFITESIHESFDGWTSREKSVIRKYLNDLGLCMTLR